MRITDKFKDLVRIYCKTDIEFPHLRVVTVAQWMLESAYGNSDLFAKFNNAGGIKYRPEMAPYGKPVAYAAHDGVENYVHFNSLIDFIKGYWRFIDRTPYQGWREHANSGLSYITFLKKCGYAGDPGYIEKVMAIIPTASALILEMEGQHTMAQWKDEDITWLERNRNDTGVTVIVAYAGGEPKAIFTSDLKADQHKFESRFVNAKTVKTAPAGKAVLSTLPEYGRGEDKPDVDAKPKVDITKSSPNQSDRGATVSGVVVHNTAGSFDSSVSWLCNSAAQASAHLVIDRDGKVAQLVPFSKKAWHAGNSRANATTIGIEIVATNNQRGITEEQSKALSSWLKWFMKEYGFKRDAIIPHRKVVSTDCPGLIWPQDSDLEKWKDTWL